MITALPRATLLGLVLILSACNAVPTVDPFQREGIWKPTGVNDANLAAQVANPADLARGRADTGGSVRTAASAVDRMWSGGQRPQGGGLAGLLGAAAGAQAGASR